MARFCFSVGAARFVHRRVAAAIALATALFCLVQTATAEPGWFADPYDYVVLDQDLRDTLTEFGRNLGVPVVLSDAVKGRVRGRVESKFAGEFLERLARGNGLTWYFDGSVLHVSADTEFATRLFDAGKLNGAIMIAQLRELGLADTRFSVRSSRDGRVITASGPPAYVAAVDQLVQRMQPEPVVAGDDPRVRVFRGGIAPEVVFTPGPHSAVPGTDAEEVARSNRATQSKP
ncbi:type III secretion protein [Brucella sp. BE17]|uniref:type III secretion protein n=1 Tax=Brucella sp. BE17 TaxID=3142977 RepID=UPI0031BBA953